MEPIAIVGFSFRLPQGAEDEASLWEMLESGRNVMTEWPESRANIDALRHGQSTVNNTLASRGAHFIDGDPGAFDAPFFSVTTKEAASMDPQQRWTLETAYRAMENAGIPAEKVAGTDTAVFAASMADDWTMIVYKDPDEAPANTATSTSPSILANRVSWYFDFRGPSIQINTACSSSMIATDLAVQCLRSGQSSMALVTGSNPLLTPEKSAYLENMSFLSPDSRCYSFDHRANGYARGEGVAVLVLKRLSDAVRDGDMIRAVIRASGSNQDGHTPGITQPSLAAQEELIRKVYKSCDLDFKLTRYVEAHGTGTQLGDSTETKALGRVFRTARSPKEPLYIGSVKANIGHTEGVSGLAGILKSIMILEKGQIPPNALFEKWNPKINAKFNNLKVPTSCTPWPTSGLRRISINSFGFGGSNGHVILDDAFHTIEALALKALTNTSASSLSSISLGQPVANGVANGLTNGHKVTDVSIGIDPQQTKTHDENLTFEVKPIFSEVQDGAQAEGNLINGLNAVLGDATVAQNGELPAAGHPLVLGKTSESFRLLVWSAKDEAALSRVLQDYSDYYEKKSSESDKLLDSLAYTLSARRSLMAWRSFSVVNGTTTFETHRLSFAKGVRTTREGGLAMVFTGQGAQYVEMGLGLLIYPVFESILLRASDTFCRLGADWLLLDEIKNSKTINSPQISQPLCTALQIALFELLRHFGVTPNAVVGHSSGEIAAAYAVGALSLESACRVAFHRGRLAQRLTTSAANSGSMMSVNLSEADVDAYLKKVGIDLDITVACVNSPKNVTISGSDAAINELQKYLEEDEIFARKLNTGAAYHSPAMMEISDEYLCSLESLEARATEGGILMVSSVTGQKVPVTSLSRGQYWVDNLVSPVRFADALQYLALAAPKADGLKPISNYLEVGPHAALKRPISTTIEEATRAKDFKYFSVLSKFEPSMKATLDVVGQLFVQGYPVSIEAANQQLTNTTHGKLFLVDAPQYPFNHSQSHWHETRISRGWRFREAAPRSILGMRVIDWNPLEPRWRKMLSVSEMPWLEDHVIGENMLFPATGSLTMALEAVKQMAHEHQPIAGYRVKEAAFIKPIVVRPDRDTEVLTHLRPLQQSFEKSALRFEVKLFTVVDEHWSECFKSTIHIEYEEPPNQVDEEQESHVAAQIIAGEFADAKEKAVKAINESDFYEHHRRQGLVYGEAFSIARGISWDGGEVVVAQVDVAPPLQSYEGLVHPAVFDAACQVCYVAPSSGMSRELPTTVPHKIRDAWISASGWQYPTTRVIRVLTNSKLKSIGSGIESCVKILSDNESLLCHIEHFELLPISSNAPSEDAAKNLLHRIDWKPSLSLLSTDQLRRYCSEHSVADETSTVDSESRDLDMLLLSIAQNNMDQLLNTDWRNAPAYMERYVSLTRHLIRQLKDQYPDVVSCEASYNILAELIGKRPTWRLFLEIAQNQTSIVRGEIDAKELLLSSGLMHEFYEGLLNSFSNSGLRPFLQLAVHQSPALRILEIGAGSGSMSNLVLSILEQLEEDTQGVAFCEYVFTDKSDLNFETSRQRFLKYENRITFKSLDFEQDIVSQGFQPASFDVVIARDVLHATKDLSAVLKSLRGILKPSGNLIFLEHTVRDSFALSFGLGILPDWWCSEDKSRTSVPLMTESEWDAMLLGNGFSGNDLIIKDFESHDAHKASIIVSSVKPSHVPSEEHRTLLVTNGEEGFQKDVASLILRARPQSLIVPMAHLAETAIRPSDYVVFLADLSNSLLTEVSESIFTLVKDLVRQTENIVWVTSGGIDPTPSSSPFTGIKDGFLRTLRSEFNNKRIIGLSLDDISRDATDCVSQISYVLEAAFGDASSEVEYVIRGGHVLTGRLVEDRRLNHELSSSIRPEKTVSPWLPGPPLKLDVGTRGQLETLHFKEDIDYYQDLGPMDVEIDAKAWAVNFRDVFSALGRLDDPEIGSDSAGIVTRVGSKCKSIRPGDRVVMCQIDCMRMYPRAQEQAVVKILPSVSFEEACAIINPGMTAWHCLVDLARLRKGEKVLIHGASGATGQLSIQIAQSIGAEVFVTVGYENKKQLLMDLYGIPADHIFYSRSNNATFARAIKRMTNNCGVDVVLNSLVGEGLRASWECIAPYGRFIEIGKTDINTNSSLPMLPFAKNAMFASVDVRHLLLNRTGEALELLHKTMTMAEQGTLHYPKPLNIYDVGSVEDAFRYIQSGKNSGRVVIRIDPSNEVQKSLITRRNWKAEDDASYLIVGGFGGVGRSILRWMATKGAKNLIVPTRSHVLSTAAVSIISELQKQGVMVTTSECNVASREALAQGLEAWSKTLPPIRGCINAAMVLNDAVFENMTSTQWNNTVHSKVSTSWNLHSLLPNLDWMIFLSSVSGVIGNPGQANYAAGCTFQDSLAQHRTRHGQRTISIDLGVMRTIGVVAESESLKSHFNDGSRGLGQVEEEELLALLDICCDPAEKMTITNSQLIMGLGTPIDFLTRSHEVPEIMQRPLFAHFSQAASSVQSSAGSGGDNLALLYRQAATAEERAKIAAQSLARKLARALAIEADDVDLEKPLHAFGVDSLVAVELRNWIAKEFAADIPVFEIMGGRTVEGVGELVEKSSQIGKGS